MLFFKAYIHLMLAIYCCLKAFKDYEGYQSCLLHEILGRPIIDQCTHYKHCIISIKTYKDQTWPHYQVFKFHNV